MTTQEYAQVSAAIDRMEAEAGCELPDLPGAGVSLADRARRLLDCDDPPRGDDLELCREIARE